MQGTLLYIDWGSFTLAEMFSFLLKIVTLLASVIDPQSCHDQSYLATQDWSDPIWIANGFSASIPYREPLLRETKRDCLGFRTAIESKLWGGWGRSQDNCTSSDLKCKLLNCLTMSRNDLTVSERLYRSQNDQCYYHLILEVIHHTMVQLPVTASPQGVPTSLINHQLNTDINTVWMLLYYGCHLYMFAMFVQFLEVPGICQWISLIISKLLYVHVWYE